MGAGTGGAGEEGARPLEGAETEPARERDRARVEGGVVTEEEVVDDIAAVEWNENENGKRSG